MRNVLLNTRRVRERIAELDLTHQELGDRLGISRAGATNLVNGLSGVTMERAIRLAAALEVPLDDILDHRRRPEPYRAGAGRQADRLWQERTGLAMAQEHLGRFQTLLQASVGRFPVMEGHDVLEATREAVAALARVQEALQAAEVLVMDSVVDWATVDR